MNWTDKQLFTGKELAPIALVTVREIAVLLKCSTKHVVELRDRRLIPHVRLGRLVRYNPGEVMKAIEKLTVQAHDYSKPKLFK